MFLTRLISGIVLVVLALIFIITGGGLLFGVMTLISLMGMFELYRVFGIEKKLPGILGYVACVVYYASVYVTDLELTHFKFLSDRILLFVCFLILLLAVYVFTYPKFHARDIMAGFFGFFYAGVLLSYLYQTRLMPHGEVIVWLIFLCSWGCDTCAYCVGVLFGKHKMSPVLSPKKSVEGAAGGVVGSMLLTALYMYFFSARMGIARREILVFALIAGIGALISMVGDLAASAIKRNYDIKDYGKLIPGHGGIMDRFDSIIITAPIIYYLALYAV